MKHLKYKTLFILVLVVAGLSNCSNSAQGDAKQNEKEIKQAKAFLANNCLSCHSPSAKSEERLGPPLFAVRKHYLKDHPEKEAFVSAILGFINETNSEKAKMKHAVEKFGLMPQMAFPENELKNALTYLFENEPAKPHHTKKAEGPNKRKDQALEQGVSMAMQTKKALGKNLMNALAVGGSAYAVDFCNLNALAITDSMEQLLVADIKRVSDLQRNPQNEASPEELLFINKFKESLAKGENLLGEIQETKEGWRVFYPILTNQMCLQCHGSKLNDINVKTLNEISAKYPQDLATGYNLNELRGVWVVDLPKEIRD